MIEKDGSDLAFRCDRCTNLSESFDARDFQSAVDSLKTDGWKVKRDHRAEGGWSHVCPDHSEVDAQRLLLGL